MEVKLIAVTQPINYDAIVNQEELIEYAGRKCTNTTDNTGNNTQSFIKARIKQGHTSILEHVNFTFEINGISRSCLTQLTRHRIASFSVQSMRYVNQKNAQITIPDSIQDNKSIMFVFNHAVNVCRAAYNLMIDFGIPKEDARFVLPIASQTDLILTMNLRELLHFFELRCDPAAQWEIRELAYQMKEFVKYHCPSAL